MQTYRGALRASLDGAAGEFDVFPENLLHPPQRQPTAVGRLSQHKQHVLHERRVDGLVLHSSGVPITHAPNTGDTITRSQPLTPIVL